MHDGTGLVIQPIASYRIAWYVLFILSCLALVQNGWYWTQLPERTATHFGSDGSPDSWMSKTAASVMMVIFQVGIPCFLVAIAHFASSLPSQWVNIPNRDYWLSPERRRDSMAYVQAIMGWIAVLVSILAMVVAHLTFVANVSGERLNTRLFGLALAIYLFVVIGLVVKLVFRFQTRPK